ncbi:IS66 family insertion sequence element accessory protein TnpB [Clostridium perfringens]|nr:IS66 family insertion sequence element accessory protein TnpB [Clostridium perfringens]
MLNLDSIDKFYLSCGLTDLRKNINRLTMIIEKELKLDYFQKALFIFSNRQMNKIKFLHFEG